MSGELTGEARWLGQMAFDVMSGSGHTLTLDASAELGGTNRGPQPMELVLLALAGCAGMSVISVVNRGRASVSGYQVRVWGERATGYPRVFTRVVVEHALRGRNLTSAAVERAVQLAASRYCAVSATLGEVADVAETWRLIDEETGVEVTSPKRRDGSERGLGGEDLPHTDGERS